MPRPIAAGPVLGSRRPLREGARTEVVDEQVAAEREGEAGLVGLGAQDVGIEQSQIGSRL